MKLMDQWTIQDAYETYNIKNWGKGYFSINEPGNVVVHPTKDDKQGIDIKLLVDQLQARGIQLPILLRFTDILRHRINEMHQAFQQAMTEFQYKGSYCSVYPIKVNQTRQVVEEIINYGAPLHFGLEAGSKPELIAVLALTGGHDVPIICNGFKDDEFIKMTMLARKLGKNIIPVVEKFTELTSIVKNAKSVGVKPVIGVRAKLAARGAGRWKLSAGYRSKFGLTITEILDAIEYLKSEGMADSLQLLHFHLGSQITNIRNVKGAINEAVRVYVELHKLGAGMRYLDVGGGLGIDYDGSQTDFESSINYTLQEYANDIVFRIKDICDEAEVPHPIIITESGRGMVAYHSVLVFDVLGTSSFDHFQIPAKLNDDAPKPVVELYAACNELNKKNYLECYHDASQAIDETLTLFNTGHLDLETRGLTERLFWSFSSKLLKLLKEMDYVPEELAGLKAMVSDTYFCNFSVFQSMPDAWAINQLFPIMPIHRLKEAPTRQGILGDITCDSDGKIDQFIDLKDVKNTLELHQVNGDPYYLGVFLVGAYQEILGDLHNLLGDTNAVHVKIDEDGDPIIEEVIKGDSVREVLAYVQYSADKLAQLMRREVEKAVKANRINVDESKQFLRFYEAGLEGYTYLEEAE
jgi:arginine decarboxylase